MYKLLDFALQKHAQWYRYSHWTALEQQDIAQAQYYSWAASLWSNSRIHLIMCVSWDGRVLFGCHDCRARPALHIHAEDSKIIECRKDVTTACTRASLYPCNVMNQQQQRFWYAGSLLFTCEGTAKWRDGRSGEAVCSGSASSLWM